MADLANEIWNLGVSLVQAQAEQFQKIDQELEPIKVFDVAYHRNGVSGNGFHVVLFADTERATNPTLVGIVFQERGNCAVLDIGKLASGDIAFGSNSYRGHVYEAALRFAIADRRRAVHA
jgi:hypothetical protein